MISFLEIEMNNNKRTLTQSQFSKKEEENNRSTLDKMYETPKHTLFI